MRNPGKIIGYYLTMLFHGIYKIHTWLENTKDTFLKAIDYGKEKYIKEQEE